MHLAQRFIPAGAGNRLRLLIGKWQPAVHPRGCGEQACIGRRMSAAAGSSPRVRGTGAWRRLLPTAARFIPAGAGNRFRLRVIWEIRAVHPRGCGEQVQTARDLGNPGGSSPRVRGTVAGFRGFPAFARFIPAGAGNRDATGYYLDPDAVHPRGCGEQMNSPGTSSMRTGSSPRVRGTALSLAPRRQALRFIPAGAGNR